MPKTENLTVNAQGASTSRVAHETSINPNTTQWIGLIHDLCRIKKSIDAFYDLQTKGVVYEDSRRYLYAERDLCSAIASLSEYVGMMLTDDFLTDKSEKSA